MTRRDREIVVEGASEHNLAGVDVRIPRGVLTVVTGVSGSGKSSLAFDTIGREAQRRFLETFPAYTRDLFGRLRRPAVRRLDGLSPSVVLDQRPLSSNPRATVGTMTEVWDLLRLLYARVGTAPAGVSPSRSLFSFNTPEGACPACQGLGVADRLDPELLVADSDRTLREGALKVSTPNGYLMYSQVTLDVLDQVLAAHGGSVDTPWRDLSDEVRAVVLHGSDRVTIPFGKHPLESRLTWTGITPRPRQEGVYKGLVPIMEAILKAKRNPSILRFVRTTRCPECFGSRLGPAGRVVTFHGRAIQELAALQASELASWLAGIVPGAAEVAVVKPISEALDERLGLLDDLGLGYLTMNRPAATLSTGEAQRARLVSLAVGALRGVLFVLDEPSVGLHPRDATRLLGVLRRLTAQGSTVLVVDHDETLLRGADWVVDLGPGAGRAGGRMLWSGPAAALLSGGPADTPTRQWLAAPGLALDRVRRPGHGELHLSGLNRNNLVDLTVTFRRGALNVITGVSGAGKTSLLQELLSRASSLAVSPPFDRILEVDSSPIGRSPRSNPATYTGVFDAIRDLFAATPQARIAGIPKGHFSFNVAGGRCEGCEGAGVVEVGMRYLGSVEVTCERCGGRRFGPEVLAVQVAGKSITDVLEMSVEEAAVHFAREPRIVRVLATLASLGLGYLPLGQPAPTLSGGEAQRVRLAAELARPRGRDTLVALDEPTTGLHAADVAVLLVALDALVDSGATVVVVEHDRQVVAAADHVVDLGPESGAGGGRVVVSGSPADVAACPGSHTGTALRADRAVGTWPGSPGVAPDLPITLSGVRTHNLKGIDVAIPFPGLTVITGPSGSGKSSLAHDTLAAEAHARFADHLSPWARRFLPRHGAADIEGASAGLTPVVAVAQRPGRRNPRSTVGSTCEVAEELRLVFARAGRQPCPGCGGTFEGAACRCGHRLDPPPLASSFSPHSEAGACPRCRGLGFAARTDPERLVTHPERPLTAGALDGTRIGRFFGEPDGQHVATLRAAGVALGVDFERPWRELSSAERLVAMRGAGARELDVVWRYRRGARSGVHDFRSVWVGFGGLVEREHERVHGDDRALDLEPLLEEVACPACAGTRLAEAARWVRFGGRTLPELTATSLRGVLAWLAAVGADPAGCEVSPRALVVTADARAEIAERLERLDDAGLGYLSLDRETASLSAGEARRVRLAAMLGGGLVGITHVLDEPTAGLHARDTARLLSLLRTLADSGNAVVVVEHDRDVIAAADHVIELGPGAGPAGGWVVASGTPAELGRSATSSTGELLRRETGRRAREASRQGPAHFTVTGASLHNLRGIDVTFPARALTVVTGVSGSGKSTLVLDVLAPALDRHLRGMPSPPDCRGLVCHEPVTALLRADRHDAVTAGDSTVASFLGVWDRIRALLARTPEARARKLTARHFSTAAPGGRCEACRGRGVVAVAMDFLPDVELPCETCGGARFGADALAVHLEGRTVAELLAATASEAAGWLAHHRTVTAELDALTRVGLGYLPLGQATASLSGGELQRLRLAPVLAAPAAPGTVILLDEPTTGLHHTDVDRLLGALDELVERGCTVVVVEHHLDVVAAADHVVDLGPEGGPDGGRVVVQGSPAAVAACADSHTGRALLRLHYAPRGAT